MSTTTFLAAQRASVLINRQQQLAAIHQAIYEPKADLEIVLIRGAGGMGKSRLVEEVLWRGGNWRVREREPRGDMKSEWDWTQDGRAVLGDLLDMNAVHLHSRANFLRAVRDALVWPGSDVSFTRYDAAYSKFMRQGTYQGDYVYLKKLEEDAEKAFFADYQANAERQRIVLVVDTVEKLTPIGGTKVLIEEGLLKPEDLAFYTYQWLLQQIEKGNLPKTTLLLVGRSEEGKDFFEAVQQAAGRCARCRITPMEEIGPFSLDDTRLYFQALKEEWEQKAQSDPQVSHIAQTFTNLASEPERAESLWIYTGGQPVRLALYTDLLIDDWTIPEPLQKDLEEARRIQSSPEALEQARREIEAGLIRLLFGRPQLKRAAILQALVRAPRGLDVEQLHYCLYSAPDESPEDWLKKSNGKREAEANELKAELEALRRLALVKIRPDGRLGLQDEVYRIYAHALHDDEKQHKAEASARQRLYQKLQAWAEYHREKSLEQLRGYQAQDEAQLRFDRPSRALDVSFPTLPFKEQEQRGQTHAAVTHWEMEALHYALLSDFTRNFNHALFEFADAERIANDEDGLAILQAERWQVLYDPAYALEEFGNLIPWRSLERRAESPLVAFRRLALQNDITDWIKLFGLRKEYERAIAFAEDLEKAIERWISTRQADPNFLPASWKHTLARHERALWRNYARVLAGKGALSAIKEMEGAAQELEKLLQYDQDTPVFPERGETGFKGHPAESKVGRLTALYYNYIGYGYANLGLTSSAKDAYGRALRSMRQVEFRHMEATTRNNLSRVLSDRGHARGRRLCLDALDLRKEKAAEIPIAYSYNTLALIDNDHYRPELAWIEAAIAVAYFRKANESRGLGLALLQLAEALRRLVEKKSEPYHLRGDPPDAVLQTAREVIDEAEGIFTNGPAAGEITRRVEAFIEKGCLERDWIEAEASQREQHYRDALYYLEQAADLARGLGNPRLELDARVNIAWTHYHFQAHEKAEQALKEIETLETLLPKDALIQEGKDPPKPERDDIYVYQQLSKMSGLRGRLALEKFQRRTEEIKQEIRDKDARVQKIHQDKTAQEFLQQAAEAFVLAVAYSQLLSPRASSLQVNYDLLYAYLKGFNLTELEDFARYVREAQEKYHTDKLALINMGEVDEFLEQTFGLFEEEMS